MKILSFFFIAFFAFVAPAFAVEEMTVIATELITQEFLMGLAGIVVAGLFWFGVIKNI